MDSTKVFVDSIKAVISCSSECSAPKQEWYANWDSVAIVAIIALAVAVTIIVCVDKYLNHKKLMSTTSWTHESDKRKWAVEDMERKQNVEIQNLRFERLKMLEKERLLQEAQMKERLESPNKTDNSETAENPVNEEQEERTSVNIYTEIYNKELGIGNKE